MKKINLLIFLLVVCLMGLSAQQQQVIDGNWLGTLKLDTTELRLAFTFTTTEDGVLKAEMTSIDQGGVKVPMDEAVLSGETLTVSFAAAAVKLVGVIDPKAGTWKTTFTQGPIAALILFKKVEHIPE